MLESWDAEEEEKPKAKPVAKKTATKAKPAASNNLRNVDEKTRKLLQKKAEIDSDLKSASDLFGDMGLNEHPRERANKAAAETPAPSALTVDTPIDEHPIFRPESKQDYEKLRKGLTPVMKTLAENNNMYYSSSLAVDLIRDMAKQLTTENIRKTISTLNVVLKEKEREERQARLAKAGGTATGGAGKKKAKAGRANLGGAFKKDTDVVVDNYDDADFGDDDFM